MAILGVIATFTIPKVLQARQNDRYNAIAKEAAAMLSEAYQSYRHEKPVLATTAINDLTPYINYVRVETARTVDSLPSLGTVDCSVEKCLLLHNGAVLNYYSNSFNGTTDLSAIHMRIDPDGKVTNGTGNAGMSVAFWIYTNGRLTTRGEILNNTINSAPSCPCTPNEIYDPDWFSWD